MKPQLHDGPLPVTDKQLEVLDGLGRGESMPAVARRLRISVHTARGHLKTALERLDAANGTQAVAVATQRGLLPLPVGGK